jgi:Fur family peroxide stress response transcriptional regulator
VDEAGRRQRIAEFERLSREQGRRLTVQRRVILEAVLELDDHPSAEQVFHRVTGRLPGVARTTVYRTLEELHSMGLVSRTCHPGRVVRYDARTEHHHHLVCTSCNEFIDIDDERLDEAVAPDTSAWDFEVTELRVQLLGTCGRCRELKRREESK